MAKFIPVKEHKEFQELPQSFQNQITQFVRHFDQEGTLFGKVARNAIKTKEIEGVIVNVKAFKVPHLVNQFVYKYLRKSKARRSFENANFLLKKGIGTPKPLAYFEYFNTTGLQKSYYVSIHQDCDLTFRELITNPDYSNREFILRAMAEFTYNLHENNILFKDHSPGNTLIKKSENNYDFFLVDLNRMEFKSLSFEERIKNFSRLTPKEGMIKIMSERYAELIDRNPDEVFNLMWQYTQTFQEKFHTKKRLKKKFGLKK